MSFYYRDLSPPINYYKDVSNLNTADRVYNVQESQRKYEELIQQNLWIKDQIDRKRHGQPIDTHPVYIQNIERGTHLGGYKSTNDMILWGMIERNRYLEQKLAKLKKQKLKQATSINKIQKSEEWQSRHNCNTQKCYHTKYMQLLRVRSPFF